VEVNEQYGDEVRIIGIPGQATLSAMEHFVFQNGADGFPHLPDVDGAIWEQFGVTEHRVYIAINDDGTATRAEYGGLEDAVQALLADG